MFLIRLNRRRCNQMKFQDKYFWFCTVGLLLAAVLVGVNLLVEKLQAFDFVNHVGMLMSISAAYLAEIVSQRRARIKLVWAEFNAKRAGLFFVYLGVLIAFVALSASKILESRGLFGYVIDMLVIYVFSGAFFEIINILKREK